jgi:hypothetical protein
MDAITSTLSDIGGAGSGDNGWMSGIQKLLGGFGVVNNLIQSQRAQGQLGTADARSRQLFQLLNNPAAFRARISQLTAPLDQNLTRGVTDTTLADLSQRGLDPRSAPGIATSAVAQALAPYEQENIQQAVNLLMSQYGMSYDQALQMAQAYQSSATDTSGFWKMFNLQPPGDPALDPNQNVYGAGPDVTNPDMGGPITPPPLDVTQPLYAQPAFQGGAS